MDFPFLEQGAALRLWLLGALNDMLLTVQAVMAKMTRRIIQQSLSGVALSLLCFMVASVALVNAQQTSGTIAQGFRVDNNNGEVVAGALVSIKTGAANSIELATAESAGRLAGVVDKNSLVTLSSNDQEAQVVLGGTTSVLVSDVNGAIKASSKITASPIAGVGMLATNDTQVVGTVQADLDTTTAKTETITDRRGKPHTVHIGYVPLQVGIAYYQAPGSNFLPPFIQSIANSIAGRPVSLMRVLFSSMLLLLGFINVGILVYTSVRSAMSSIGRNPLAATAIRKGLYQTSAVAVVVLAITLLGSYLLLSV